MSRANDIYENRIEKVLSAMDSIKLYALPKSEPWTLDRFLEEIKDACKDAAADLNRKSVMIEDAVEDLIGLALQALNLPDPEADENGVPSMVWTFGISKPDFSRGGKHLTFRLSVPEYQNSKIGDSRPVCTMVTKKRKKQDSVGSTDPDRGSNLLQVRDKNSQNAVNGAAKELRRNYSKKVADNLAVLTKTSLKMLSKHFSSASTDVKVEDVDTEAVSTIVFVLIASLSIPDIDVRPSIDEVQLVLINAGKIILSVSKGVATWRKSTKKSKKESLKNGSGKKGDKDFVPSSESNREMKLYNPKKEEKPVITEKTSNFFKSV
eukprot:01115.XXX_1211_3656_1 [CDS] Oithona nana genome sequencing.